MKWIWAGVLAAGIAASWTVHRLAIEPSRRYSELLEACRANEGRVHRDWEAKDAERFWSQVFRFQETRPAELSRRLLEDLLDDATCRPAATAALGILSYEGYDGNGSWSVVADRIPPPPGSGRHLAVHRFGLKEALLESREAAFRLAASDRADDRWLLLHAAWESTDPRPGRGGVLRMAESDSDPKLRQMALKAVGHGYAGGDPAVELARAAGSADPVVRLQALSGLALLGDAQAGRELLLGIATAPEPLSVEARYLFLWDLSPSLRESADLGLELQNAVGAAAVAPDVLWELAERLGGVLERRAVGDFDEPVAE